MKIKRATAASVFIWRCMGVGAFFDPRAPQEKRSPTAQDFFSEVAASHRLGMWLVSVGAHANVFSLNATTAITNAEG